jgi:gas vesicle protein
MPFDVNNINVRDKLILECPNVITKSGNMKIDFGAMFLSAQGEETVAQMQSIVADATGAVMGVIDMIDEETLILVKETVEFIIKDLITTVTSYCVDLFNTYISPEFAISLAKELVTKTLEYTTANIKNPADILKEVSKDAKTQLEDDTKRETQEKIRKITQNIQDYISDTMEQVKLIMDEIQPYTSEIAKYIQLGPEYFCGEVEAIYKKFLNMGVSLADEQVAKVNEMINTELDFCASWAGKNAANGINITQEWIIRGAKKLADATLAQVKIKALSIINKVLMQLLAIVGG